MVLGRSNFKEHVPAFGDAVRLRTGGPPMLVVDINDDDLLVCAWRGVQRVMGIPRYEICEAPFSPLNLFVLHKARA